MAKKRRTYTREFKVEAVKLVTEKGYSVAEAARSLGIHETLLRSWKQAFEAAGRPGLPRTRQAPALRGGASPAPRREQAAAGGARHLKKSDGLLRQGGAVIFPFIEEHHEQWPVAAAVRGPGRLARGLLRLAASDPPAPSSNGSDALLVEIRAAHAEFKDRYGSPRIHAELAARGHDCCVNTVAKLMRRPRHRGQDGAEVPLHHRLQPPPAGGGQHAGPAVRRRGPNEAWVADITYIPTREGWLYLAAVEDLYSRRVVGWSMADHMESRLVVDALEMAVRAALARRRAAGPLRPRQPVRQRPLPTPPGQARDHVQHEPPGGLLGQRSDGELLRHVEEGVGPPRGLRHPGGGPGQHRRVHRGLLQHQRRHSSLGYVSPAEYERTENR